MLLLLVASFKKHVRLLACELAYSSVSQLLDKEPLLFPLTAQHIFRHCSPYFFASSAGTLGRNCSRCLCMASDE